MADAVRVPVDFPAPDGILLRGEVVDGGGPTIILVHELGRDVDCWGASPEWLAQGGFRVVAFDLRGHGASDGEVADGRVTTDVGAAMAAVRRPGDTIVVVGAGDAAAGTTDAAVRDGADGLVLVSPDYGPGEVPLPERVVLPCLALIDSGTEARLAQVRAVQAALLGWRTIVHAGTADAGSTMFTGTWAAHAHEHVRAFAKQARRSRQPRPED